MKTAYVQIRPTPPYRSENFLKGLRALGYQVTETAPTKPLRQDDVAVIWNKCSRSHQHVDMARKGGGALIVAENGYYGKDKDGVQPYALALDGHNGSGRFYVGDDSRLKRLGIEFKPWRAETEKGHIVIADQRGIGSKLMRSPGSFGQDMISKVGDVSPRPIKYRPHPGRHAPTESLEDALKGAHLLIVWSSNSATKALILGIPVMYCAPYISTMGASRKFKQENIASPEMPDRTEAFVRMSWQQFFVDEVGSGFAFDTLLRVHRGELKPYHGGAGI